MNKWYPIWILLSLWIILTLMSNSMGRANVNSAANTGAPCEDGTICRDCHLGGNFGPISESVTLVDQITGLESTDYVPGMRYDVTISVIPTGAWSRYGFLA